MSELDYRLKLSEYTFDPLEDSLDLPDELRIEEVPQEPAYYIIQFTKSLTQEEMIQIQGEYGLDLTEYVPEYAYLEKISPQTLAALSEEPLFRASTLYQPAFKISPYIGQTAFHTPERQAIEGLWLRAVLLLDADPSSVAEAIQEIGASEITVLDDREIGGVARVQFELRSGDVLPMIAQLEAVEWIEEVGEAKLDNSNTAGTIQSGTPGTVPSWNQGLHGEGQIIGVIDSVVDTNHCFFRDNLNNAIRPAHRKVVGFRNVSGSAAGSHGTFVAGIAVGDDFNNPGTDVNRGMAWAARITFGNSSDLGNSSLLAYLTAAAADGAAIHTNSWHDEPTPQYSQDSVDVDTFVWNNEDNLVLGSSGNVGEAIGPPGTAKNALCVSATQRDPNEMNFGDGNDGPTPDGRRKPDLFAPGCSITSAQVNTTCTTNLSSECATSWATPAVAGTAALIRQYYTEGWYPTGTRQPHHAFVPSGALIKATLLNSTINMTGIAGYPGNREGWGLIRLNNVLYFDSPRSARNLRVWDTRNADGLTTGKTREHHIDVASNTQFLKVTLVWTEPPGKAGSNKPVVNNLDLQVISPNGTQTFRGNHFVNGVSATGGTADTLNNVEMVSINRPAVGEWTIRIIGTAVNRGNPGQGYALVATADLTEPPAPTGTQDTLVVRVKFSDIAFEPSLPNLQNTLAEVVKYFKEVSYGKATVQPNYRGPITLKHPKSYYYHPTRNLLIEMTEEVVAELVKKEPNIFNTIERLILVTNDVNFTEDWATTGPWPYNMPGGFTRPISVSIQSYKNDVARFTHGLAHQFNLVDLYAHPGVVFPRAYVDEWDNMAGLFNNVHPLVWSKQRAGWLKAHGSKILYIPRPSTGKYSKELQLFFQESTDQNRKAIAIGLTEGKANLADENVFYFIEARDKTSGFDKNLPGTGVLIYYVNELIPQGQGPVILRDKNPGTPHLRDAFFTVGDSHTIPGTGITIKVKAGTGGAAYNIQVDYSPPATDYNVYITKGDTIGGKFYTYFSPDIWIDSPKKGFQLSAGPPPHDKKEDPVIGTVNRIYARIHNNGPGTAYNFDVRFRISEPYHTVGGKADFDQFVGIKHIDKLEKNKLAIVYVEWTPQAGKNTHACVLVDLINLVGNDTNPNDNEAQENLRKVKSITSSPFHPVEYRYNLTNPYDEQALFYFRAEGAPPDWQVTLSPWKILLDPGDRMTGLATIQPPSEAEICTSEHIQITSWTPRGDTLIPVGGAVVQVDLRRPTLLTLDVGAERCRDEDYEQLYEEQIDPDKVQRRCGRIIARGCTDPPLPGQEIIVKFTDPLGNPVFHTVVTNEYGCFEDFLVTVTGGNWKVTAEYEGGECEGSITAGPETICWCPELM